MSRLTVTVMVTVALLLPSPAAAYAKDWWGRLEEFSGPGPFLARYPWFNRHLTFHCPYEYEEVAETDRLALFVPSSSTAERAAAPPPSLTEARALVIVPRNFAGVTAFGTPIPTLTVEDTRRKVRVARKYCLYFDQTSYRADASRGFPAMRASAFEFGASIFLHGPFEIGAGGGAIRFEAERGSAWQALVTPFRFQIRPLFFVNRTSPGESSGIRNAFRRLANSPKFYFKMSAVMGELDAADLGLESDAAAAPTDASRFRSPGELVSSYGFVFDFGELLGIITERRQSGVMLPP